jgi:hypothetical protein
VDREGVRKARPVVLAHQDRRGVRKARIHRKTPFLRVREAGAVSEELAKDAAAKQER